MGRIIYEGVLFDRAELEYRMKHKLPPFDSATEERRKARATDSRNASTPVEKFTVASTPSRKGKKVMATGWKVTRKSLRKTVSATVSHFPWFIFPSPERLDRRVLKYGISPKSRLP